MSKPYAAIVFKGDASIKDCQQLIASLKKSPLIAGIKVAVNTRKQVSKDYGKSSH